MHLLSDRELRGIALHDIATENGVTHFGTLKIGLLGRSRIDINRELIRPLGEVVRAYARDRNNLSKRTAVKKSDLPFIVGTVELRDKAGSLDPHLHYFVRLRPDEEPRYRGFLRTRFGRDCTKGAEALPALAHPPGTSADWRPWLLPYAIPADGRPIHPIILRRDAEPTFDLQQLYDDGLRAATYSAKQGSGSEIVSHLDLFEA
ncbi:hypothetical protein BH10PSE2_BH10PSE2_11890 [soil metagenome]